jgi:hypothetical protein
MDATYTIRISQNGGDASARWYWEVADERGCIVVSGLSFTHAAAREQAGDTLRQQQSAPWSLSAQAASVCGQ